eukprot:m.274344 g.274344  ORF g.274344 m.274344 type:complete len:149 (+) comp69062_c0_seq1:649-1095(+)
MGAAADTEYAETVRSRLRKATKTAVIKDTFLDASAMVDIYSRTLLNFHPALHDAYGMTIVEAASVGAPTLVNTGDKVGAMELLKPGAIFEGKLDDSSATSAQVKQLLQDRNQLDRVGETAQRVALAYDTNAYAKALVSLLGEARGGGK